MRYPEFLNIIVLTLSSPFKGKKERKDERGEREEREEGRKEGRKLINLDSLGSKDSNQLPKWRDTCSVLQSTVYV
jgi:hypothetical protein